MQVLSILTYPDPKLAMSCEEVTDFARAASLAQDMLQTMYDAKGRGLAAPQVGILQRLFVMDATWKDAAKSPRVFINPRVIKVSDTLRETEEGCLSLPEVTSWVTRPETVTVAWTDPEGSTHEETFTGFESVCVQHEIDHLDGILTLDRVDRAVGDDLRALLAL